MQHQLRGWQLGAALACALLLAAATAYAEAEITPEAEAQAKLHFRQGKAEFELGRFAEALAQYEKAYQIAPLPGLLFNIGQCYRNLGKYEKAIFAFRLYLRKRPEAANRDAVLGLLRELRQKIDEQRVPVYNPESRPKRDPDLTTNPPPPPPSTPVYKRWWFWSLLVMAAGGAATGIYFGTRARGPNLPNADYSWDLSRAH